MYTESVFLWSALNDLIFKLCFSEYCRHIRSCKFRYFPAGGQKSQGIYSAYLRFIHCRQFCNVFLKVRNPFLIEEYCIARRKFESAVSDVSLTHVMGWRLVCGWCFNEMMLNVFRIGLEIRWLPIQNVNGQTVFKMLPVFFVSEPA